MDRPEFSEMLATRRRELGYSIGQASRVLRLREDVLIAFEDGNFEGMPKSGYAQGMLSSYARYLGLDAGMVVEAYNKDLKAYRRGMRSGSRRRSSSDASAAKDDVMSMRQPRVPSRGLLPTSGGYAGDMGSFATTRVHVRSSEQTSEADESYPQGRPYTRKAPSSGARRGDRSRGTNDINTLELDYSQYDDDLNSRGVVRPYDAATSRSGRSRTRSEASKRRPKVNRRSGRSTSARSAGSGRGRDDRSTGSAKGLLERSPNLAVVMLVAIVLVLVIVMVVSISSCVNQGASTTKTVPVSTTTETDTQQKETSQPNAQEGNTSDKGSEPTKESAKTGTTGTKTGVQTQGTQGTTGTSAAQGATSTSVSVSVADGGVTWLEISCDGRSEVAETVTGPWQKTYIVKSAITVSAGDPAVMTVTQDGKQVTFESMASGIGTIRIQGPGLASSGTKKETAGTTDATSETTDGNTAKMGNSNAATTSEDATSDGFDESESDASGYYGYDEYSESVM